MDDEEEHYQQVYECFKGDSSVFLKQLVEDDVKIFVLHRENVIQGSITKPEKDLPRRQYPS